MSTIADVCKLAGVSKATVSRVINGTGQVKPSTRETVYAAMKQLGYRPNSLAQALATNQTNSIGLVVSNFEGAYFGTLLRQAAASAEAANKQLIVTDGHDDPGREYEAVRMLEDRCDAIVLYTRTMSSEQLKQLQQVLTIPLVLINRSLPETLFHTVIFDQQGAVHMMMDHLVSYGHHNIACITGPLSTPTDQARFAGYQDGLKQHGIEFTPERVASGDFRLNGGYLACKELLSRGVTFSAVVAFNDYMALGALKALTEAGIQVPEQVSIAGIDNDPMAEFSQPSLTTIELPIQAMAEQAFAVALKLIKEKSSGSAHQYQGKLIQRDSVMPLKSARS